MTIKANTQYTREAILGLARYNTTKTRGQKILYAVMELIMLAMGLLMIRTSENKTEFWISVFLLTPFFLLIVPMSVKLTPKLLAKTSQLLGSELIGSVNSYELSDEGILVKSRLPFFDLESGYNGESRLSYQMLESVHETEDTFYLYISKQQAYILKKADIAEGTVKELQSLLRTKLPAEKYCVGKKNSKWIAVCAVIAVLAVALTGWYTYKNPYSQQAKEKVFTKAGLSVTLTEDFREDDHVSFTATYQSKDMMLVTLKEEYEDFGGVELTLEEYANLVIEVNQLDAEVKEIDGLTSFSYVAEASGREFYYFAAVYEGSDAFWMVQCWCDSEDYEELNDTILQYAKSVVVE